MNIFKNGVNNPLNYIKVFLKWIIISLLIGIVGGFLGSIFHECIDIVTNIRLNNKWVIFLLPLGGLVIALIYSHTRKKIDTNCVIDAIKTDSDVPWYMMPAIFISTVITHFLGGSAGREGAALQLGGSIGYNIGRLLKLNKNDMHIIIMAGMSAVFTAMFGTPLAAAFFALEVTSVGIMYYAALLPCIIASLCAKAVADALSIAPVSFTIPYLPDLSVLNSLKVIILSIMCALVCILFCTTMKKCESLFKKHLKNTYIRAFIGGLIIIILTIIVGNSDYNGAGMNIISNAISGNANAEAFILKIIFTVITISAGFKGGEIVPAFFIGSTFGCVAGAALGLPPGFSAAIGLIALFCGLVNCPVSSLLLGIEIFGGVSIEFFALTCAVTYLMSGYCGLYKSQKIVYSKLKAELLDTDNK